MACANADTRPTPDDSQGGERTDGAPSAAGLGADDHGALDHDGLRRRWCVLVGANGAAAGADLLARYGEPHRRYHDVVHLADVLHHLDTLLAPARPSAPDDPGPVDLGQTALTEVYLAAFFHDAIYPAYASPAAGAVGPAGEAGTAGAEESTGDTARLQTARTETTRTETARTETARTETARTETGRTETAEEASARLATSTLSELGFPPASIAEVARLVRLTTTHDPDADDLAGAALCDADLAILAADSARYAAYTAGVRAEYATVPAEAFRAGRAEILSALLELPWLYSTARARAWWERPARRNVTAEIASLRDRTSPSL